MTVTLAANSLPPRPRAVLRLGFAGRRRLDGAEAILRDRLGWVLEVLAHRLAGLTPGTPVSAEPGRTVTAFYDPERPPLLRLVTGLCEGADAVAAEALGSLHIHPDGSSLGGDEGDCVSREWAAVLPFDLPAYRASRDPEFLEEFDRQVARCAYIAVADGIYDRGDAPPDASPDERDHIGRVAKYRRAKAYRTQSALLLRQCDILIAATDPGAEAKAGGTLETVHMAQAPITSPISSADLL